MHKAFIGLGSNQGDQISNLRQAIGHLNQDYKIKVEKVSSVYKTEPVGYEDQPWFFNAVAKVETSYEPEDLLKKLLQVESLLGRVRIIRWGPRTLDLDLLLFDDLVYNSENLTLPHPRMLERDFVIVPLVEIEPDLIILGKKITEIANETKNLKKVVSTGDNLC